MTDQTQKSPAVSTAAMAGVAGAVVGAGVAVAATQILSDKHNRDKVKDTFNKVKTQVMDTIHEEQKRMNETSGNGQQKQMTEPKKEQSGNGKAAASK